MGELNAESRKVFFRKHMRKDRREAGKTVVVVNWDGVPVTGDSLGGIFLALEKREENGT